MSVMRPPCGIIDLQGNGETSLLLLATAEAMKTTVNAIETGRMAADGTEVPGVSVQMQACQDYPCRYVKMEEIHPT